MLNNAKRLREIPEPLFLVIVFIFIFPVRKKELVEVESGGAGCFFAKQQFQSQVLEGIASAIAGQVTDASVEAFCLGVGAVAALEIKVCEYFRPPVANGLDEAVIGCYAMLVAFIDPFFKHSQCFILCGCKGVNVAEGLFENVGNFKLRIINKKLIKFGNIGRRKVFPRGEEQKPIVFQALSDPRIRNGLAGIRAYFIQAPLKLLYHMKPVDNNGGIREHLGHRVPIGSPHIHGDIAQVLRFLHPLQDFDNSLLVSRL